jgi:tetratricopeptide (TPR) repeat protein
MFHETSHLLTHMIAPEVRYPTWLNEGMAEVFGAAAYDPEAKGLSIGRVQSGRLAVLQSQIEENGWMQLETLLRAPRISALGYAWAWSFCHFCMTSPKYEKGFHKYFLAIGRSSHIERRHAMPGVKTVDTDEAIEALRRYLKVKELEELQAEWYAWLKGLLKRAEFDYHQAAFIMDLHGEDRKAREFFKKAIDAGSRNAFDYFNYARLQHKRGKVGVAYKRCKEALAFDPLHARALALLGQCTYEKEDQDAGLKLVRLARELQPDDGWIWYVEAVLEQAEQENREQENR